MKFVAIMTSDFRLYHGLVREMKREGIRYITLKPGEPVPPHVALVISSESECPSITFSRKICTSDPVKAVEQSRVYLTSTERCLNLVIGIDPGKKPGIAVVCDGRTVEKVQAMSPEDCLKIVRRALYSREYGSAVIRIGHGDLTNRNRIIRALRTLRMRMELVDESNTTKSTKNSDTEAAESIAFTRGKEIRGEYGVVPTDGEIREIQRRSRIESRGALTIGKELAKSVARGNITMENAIEEQRKRNEKKRT